MKPTADKSGVTIEWNPNGLPPKIRVKADPHRLKQVFLNLLSNGIKYNKDGGQIRVLVNQPTNKQLRIEFKDTGIGIPAKKLHRLFTPFDRLDIQQKESDIEGTGLGLALAEKLVKQMDGQIEVTSQQGKGSTFSIRLGID